MGWGGGETEVGGGGGAEEEGLRGEGRCGGWGAEGEEEGGGRGGWEKAEAKRGNFRSFNTQAVTERCPMQITSREHCRPAGGDLTAEKGKATMTVLASVASLWCVLHGRCTWGTFGADAICACKMRQILFPLIQESQCCWQDD